MLPPDLSYHVKFPMLLALLIWLVAAAVTGLILARRWWFPEAINAHGVSFDSHLAATFLLTGPVFIAAHAALGWVILRYRGVRTASGPVENNRLEFLWTAAAAILFVGIAAAGTGIWAGVHFDPAPKDAIRVEALGKQFAWSFRYPGRDGKFGRTDIRLINDSNGNPFGIDERDAAGRDDISTAALRVPAGRPVLLTLRSRDVIHNFFVRELRLKQDLVPGMEIPFWFQADKAGEFEVACSELCGLGHHQMRTSLIVLPAAEFEAWLRQMHEQLGLPSQPETR